MSRITRLAKQYLETEKQFGATEISREWLGLVSEEKPQVQTHQNPLDVLRQKALTCQQCTLSKTRKHVVFGEGNPQAKLMFVGEAPGFDEDTQGKPFVGKSGQLLTKIIQAMGLTRDDVYIANCLKCRPPQNRNPLPEEITSCNPILREQIEIIQPEVICALGTFAAQTLLQTQTPISRLRGSFHDYCGIRVMPTFHPAYLLHNPGEKKLVWQDMQLVLLELGLPIPGK